MGYFPGAHVPDSAHALASAKRGSRYRITQLVFSMVRDRCADLGLHPGDEVDCIDNRGWAVHLQRSDGRRVILDQDYAWFVEVELVHPPDTGASPQR
jgi:Fe2+ transport system protein FeoA